MSNINREILALARESRGYTQTQLSEILKVEQGTISKIENGQLSVSDELVESISLALNYPSKLFYIDKKILKVEGHYRKKISLPTKQLKECKGIMTFAEWHIETLINAINLPIPNIPSWDIEVDGSPADAAVFVREFWKIPRGRINDLAKIIEDNGILIVPLDLGDMDALATFSLESNIPVIYINKKRSADRIRFNLAHELAHYVCHFGKKIPAIRESKDIEIEANEFASELLLPSKDIAPHLVKLNLEKLADLKRYWKVSMQAILYKASKVGVITTNQYHYLWKQMGFLGYRKKEPVDIEPDKPTMLSEILDTYIQELNYTKSEIADILFLTQSEFEEQYMGVSPRFKAKMQITKQ